jgi:hypothetical protein
MLSTNSRTGTMPTSTSAMVWSGRILSAMVVLFLLFDGVTKLVPIPIVTSTLVQLGYPADPGLARAIGILTLVPTLLYVMPRTAVLGAVLLTGLFGGAMATHLRVGSPVFSHLLFGAYLGLMTWGGLYLRNAQLRALFPLGPKST